MSSIQPEPDTDPDMVDETCREEFELAWLTGERKPIEQCLPDPESARYRPTLEELICIQMELQWKAAARARSCSTIAENIETFVSLPTPVEDFVERFPVLHAFDVQKKLIRQEFLIRRRFGDHPEPDDYRTRFPNIDIETVLSSDDLNTVDGLYESSASDSAATVDSGITIEGYDLIEQLGAGGMGVVFRARQIAADREVALKLIRADRLQHVDESARNELLDRFRVEAQATARLDHPHVVGIFEVNVSNPDTPWFSMQLVEGETLSERLKSGPVSCRDAAEFTRQVADAIAAAHAQNILHRDLKPQNIFLRVHEQQVLVGDFGLAKFALDDSGRTSHDDILGTPAYMSPEQIRDSAGVGAATDIWSIGATLYHLLCGRPPFQAATAMDTLRHVLDHEPTSPRLLNPSVDRDLETICLKCLQKDSAKRYSTAGQLREDLELYLSGRPIQARPVSRAEHVVRWCRRNPLPSLLAAATVIAVVIAIVGLGLGYRTAALALADSKASHQFARQTVHDMLTEVSETVLLDKPGMQPLRRQLYELALAYYRKFVTAGHNSAELQDETGDVWFRIGRLQRELGNLPDAEAALTTAREIQLELVAQEPSAARRQALSSTWNALGGVFLASEQWAQAADAFLRALEIRTALQTADPANPDISRLVANTHMNLGAVHRHHRHFVDAREAFRLAADIQKSILEDRSLTKAMRRLVTRDHGMALYNLANVGLDMKGVDLKNEITAALNDAAGHFQTLLTEEPDSYADRRRLILCRQLQAESQADEPSGAESAEQASVQMMQLVRENPKVPSLFDEWVQMRILTGRLLVRGGKIAEAAHVFQDALAEISLRREGSTEVPSADECVLAAENALCLATMDDPNAIPELREAQACLQQTSANAADDRGLRDLETRIRQALDSADK